MIARSASAEVEPGSETDHGAVRPDNDAHLVVEANAGPSVGRLIDIPFWGGEVSGGLGVRYRTVSVLFDAHYARGRTDFDLGTQWGGLRTTFLWTPGRLRIGGGFDVVYLGIDRSYSGSIGHVGAGGFAHLGVDVVRFDEGAIEIAFRPEATLFTSEIGAVSGTLVAGIRW
ncbi:MAG: hypothetical protein ABI461_19305 [Polyangiaceae bacterium]